MVGRIDLPVCLIQSTHDQYVPASEAGQLFGPDTSRRQFHAIESNNHSFSDERAELFRVMQSSIDWLSRASAAAHTSGAGS